VPRLKRLLADTAALNTLVVEYDDVDDDRSTRKVDSGASKQVSIG
jgi:hypothetical protein